MVTPHGWDYALLLLGAAILGAIGGFAAELMQTRGKVTGAIAWPRRRKGPPRLTEFGWIGSVILGAIAGVAILYFLPPTTAATPGAAPSYDVVKGVALALIAGSAGRALLTSMQARLLANLNEQQARNTAAVGTTQIEHQADAAPKDAATAVTTALQKANVSGDTANQIITDVTADVGSRSKARADRAHTVIAAVTPTPPLA